jgi:hypothetical protein
MTLLLEWNPDVRRALPVQQNSIKRSTRRPLPRLGNGASQMRQQAQKCCNPGHKGDEHKQPGDRFEKG